jgi:hypothetical protein
MGFGLTQAGVNKDSDGLVKEAVNDPGFHLNRKVINMQFIKNNTRLKINTTVPTILSQSDRYGTTKYQSRTLAVYLDSLLECRTLAIPPVAIVIVYHVQVKQPTRSRIPTFSILLSLSSLVGLSLSLCLLGDVADSGPSASSRLSVLFVRSALLFSPLCMPCPRNISSSGDRGDS